MQGMMQEALEVQEVYASMNEPSSVPLASLMEPIDASKVDPCTVVHVIFGETLQKKPSCSHVLCKLLYERAQSIQENVSPLEKHNVETGEKVRIISDKMLMQRCKSLGLEWKPVQYSHQETLIQKRPNFIAKRLPLSDSE